ncbi:MAG: aldolase/citrate lyase family protein [Acidimicrobiales bacterium]
MVKRLLDSGTQALFFPMVQSVDEAMAVAPPATHLVVLWRRWRGSGYRLRPHHRLLPTGRRRNHRHRAARNQAALDAAVEIGTVDGVDGVFFGPADIGADIGFVGQPMHPSVWDLIRPTATKLIEAGVPVGTIVTDLAFATDLLNSGFTFVACANDTGLLAQAADDAVATVRRGLT